MTDENKQPQSDELGTATDSTSTDIEQGGVGAGTTESDVDHHDKAGSPNFVEQDYNLDLKTPELEDSDPDSCSTRCCGECGPSYPGWFSLQEGSKTIDVPASFGPTSWWARLIKFCFFAATCTVLLNKWIDRAIDGHGIFFLSYLTHWGMIISTIYFFMSFINSLQPPKQPTRPSDSVSLWTKICWLMFEGSAGTTLLVTGMWWTLVYKPGEIEITAERVYMHGVVLILVWIDGLAISRIPVRLKHIPLFMFLSVLYITWLIIHQLATDIGDPTNTDNDPETNDDLIYPAIDFEESPVSSSVLCGIVIFAFVPIVIFLPWVASLWSFPCSYSGLNRRYVPVNGNAGSSDNALSRGSGTSTRTGASAVSTDNVNVYEA